MAEEKRIKISELPDVGESLDGFFTVGTKEIDGVLTSVKANLGFVKQAADGANEAANGANEAAERAEAAADSLKDLEPFSDDEWDDIVPPEPPKRLYTENSEVEDYLNDDFAQSCGYDTLEDMVADYPKAALAAGSQMFERTDEEVEYDGEKYELWKLFVADGGVWKPVVANDSQLYGLLRKGVTKKELIAMSMMSNINNRICAPFISVWGDGDEYHDMPDVHFTLVYVE